ncbi:MULTISPECIES: NYN domain-containing protein [unclassified Knoellia]|uniref:NYN domain-containing protein n=1 Tax=Knoellia altitudinis TaxID=3404795 RepID=UPI0036209842
MPDTSRVAVYLDFDNMVISRYDNLHGVGSWRRDNAREHAPGGSDVAAERLAQAVVDLGAIIDYASSFGTVALTRAYADWSVPANAAYRSQLIDRAVDLVQLFATSGTKNGADIRLSIDAINDLVDHADLTHVVIVAGDSDYIALAQRCRRMGRFVVGIGVTGSTSRALVAACDEFSDYGDLPGVRAIVPAKRAEPVAKKAVTKKASARTGAASNKAPARKAPTAAEKTNDKAAELLVRAIRVGMEKSDDEWLHSSSVKSQMQRMDSTFKEKSLGYSSFRAFVESHGDLVELQSKENGQLTVRLR